MVLSRRHNSRAPAFTLIELLIVVAILAALVAILVPSLSKARVRAQQVVSANNMRQLGLAMHMYQDDNQGYFPITTHSNAGRRADTWLFKLAKYLSDVELVSDPENPGRQIRQIGRVRICPRDPRGEDRLKQRGTSYIVNEYVAVPWVQPFGGVVREKSFNRREWIKRPLTTAALFVGADDLGVTEAADHTHSRGWVGWPQVLIDIEPDRYGTRSTPADTDGSTNILYADWRVAERDALELKSLIDQGVNFADPAQAR